MGWLAYHRDGTILREETHGRPADAGEEGKLRCIVQEDYGHKVAVDLNRGVIGIDYEFLDVQTGNLAWNPRAEIWICEDSNIVGDLYDVKAEYVWAFDDNGKRIRDGNGQGVKVRNDILIPLIWRPIWLSRVTNGVATKIIGAQTTLPEMYGGRNVKKMVNLFADGRIGIF